jgi:hypothetical protein
LLDPFQLCLALGPVVIYLLLLAAINVLRRPLLVTGSRDLGALGLTLAGMVVIGPMQLFLPASTFIDFRSATWVLLVLLYLLVLFLCLLTTRPRLVIYNIAVDELRPVLSNVVAELDSEPRWAGDSVAMPNLGIQFHLEIAGSLRNISLISIGSQFDAAGWRRLERSLRTALAEVQVRRNPHAASLLGAAAMLGTVLLFHIASNPEAMADSLYGLMEATLEIGHHVVHTFSAR